MFPTCCGCSSLHKISSISQILKSSRTTKTMILESGNFSLKTTTKVIRSYVTRASMLNNMNIFDQDTKTHQKNVAAQLPDHHVYDYLRVEVCEKLLSEPFV